MSASPDTQRPRLMGVFPLSTILQEDGGRARVTAQQELRRQKVALTARQDYCTWLTAIVPNFRSNI